MTCKWILEKNIDDNIERDKNQPITRDTSFLCNFQIDPHTYTHTGMREGERYLTGRRGSLNLTRAKLVSLKYIEEFVHDRDAILDAEVWPPMSEI